MHKEHTQHNQRNPHNPHNQLERSKMDAIFQPQALRLWEVHQTSLKKNLKQVPTLFDIRIICLRVILHHVSGRVASVVSHGRASLQIKKQIQNHSENLCNLLKEISHKD